MHTDYDRIFVEFGRVKHIAKGEISFNGVIFDDRNEKSNKVVIRTNVSRRYFLKDLNSNFLCEEKKTNLFVLNFLTVILFVCRSIQKLHLQKILQNGLFLTVPYSFYTNQTIDLLAYQYGLRICAFNNSKIENPFAVDWNQGRVQSVSIENDNDLDINQYFKNVIFNALTNLYMISSIE